MTLDENTGGTVLAGETSTVTLTADNSAPDPAVVADWG